MDAAALARAARGRRWSPRWLPDDAWEAVITTLNLFAALRAGVAAGARPRAARAPAARVRRRDARASKVGATFLQSQSGLAFDWATPGALAGLAVRHPRGAAGAAAAARVARDARGRSRWSVALVFVNLLPVNPYFDVVLADWRQGRYLHFNGLAHWLAWMWPYAALVWLGVLGERAWLTRRGQRA